MEKLIELLNEYKKTRVKEYWIEFNIWEEKGELHIIIDDGQYNYSGGTCDTDIAISYIISKKFGFISWLVENDKIDEYKVIELEHNGIRPFKLDNLYGEIKLEERLIMLLSISDTPIEDLILYLK